MTRTWTAVILAVVSLPCAARAGSYLQDDVGLSSTQATEANPQSGAASNNLSGRYEFNDKMGAGAHAELTHANASAPPPGSPFASSPLISGSNVLDLGLSMDWDPTPHFSTTLSLDLGPQSTQYTDPCGVCSGAGETAPREVCEGCDGDGRHFNTPESEEEWDTQNAEEATELKADRN